MTWFEFRILTNILLFFIFLQVHWHFLSLYLYFLYLHLSQIHFPTTTNCKKLMKNFRTIDFCYGLNKRTDQNVGKGGERSVLCLEIPSFASCSGIRFPSFSSIFGEIFCFKNVSTVLGKIKMFVKMSSTESHRKKRERRRWED